MDYENTGELARAIWKNNFPKTCDILTRELLSTSKNSFRKNILFDWMDRGEKRIFCRFLRQGDRTSSAGFVSNLLRAKILKEEHVEEDRTQFHPLRYKNWRKYRHSFKNLRRWRALSIMVERYPDGRNNLNIEAASKFTPASKQASGTLEMQTWSHLMHLSDAEIAILVDIFMKKEATGEVLEDIWDALDDKLVEFKSKVIEEFDRYADLMVEIICEKPNIGWQIRFDQFSQYNRWDEMSLQDREELTKLYKKCFREYAIQFDSVEKCIAHIEKMAERQENKNFLYVLKNLYKVYGSV